ncbi:MAG TPA: hypothetical protein VFK30_12170 [Anaerolineae bacterium]|nr:hypothetical protein [Anaerolineae bacterium]
MKVQSIDLDNLQVDPQVKIDPSNPRQADTYCWVCGAAIVDVHCKIVCKNCGFMRDCSDL